MKTYLLLICTLIISTVQAATVTWTNGSTDGLWNTPANWSGGAVPLPGDDVVFNATSVTNCTVDAPGASFDGLTVTAAYTGIIDLNGQPFVSAGTNNSTLSGGTINDTPGTSNISITTTGIYTGNGTVFGANVLLVVGRMEMDGSTYNGSFTGTQTGGTTSTGSGNNTFAGICNINNTGSGEIRLGATNPDIFNGVTTANSNGTSYIRFAFGAVGTQFNGNLIVNSNASLGIRIGTGTGTATLAAGSTITTTGYDSGDLFFQNFTQTGGTAQNLSLTGTARINMQSSTWNGDVNFDAPRIYFDGDTFNGTADLEKTGAGGDNSLGNNTFVGNTILRNSGSAGLGMGNGNPDDFQADLTLINNGTSTLNIALAAAGHNIGGNLTISNLLSATSINIGNAATSTLAITGNVVIDNNASSATSSIIFGNQGDITVGGNLTFTNTSSGNASNNYVANGTNSSVSITGTTTVTNSGTGATTQRIYVGNSGDITLGGVMTLTNNAVSTNSEMYVHNAVASSAVFSENIVLSAPNGGTCDGIRFGEGGGTGTLAASKTISLGGTFDADILRFSNFTQTGGTAQSLSLTGTARLYISDANWGGNVDFDAPRLYSGTTVYSGTVDLEKTGATGDTSPGGNTFTGNTILTNTGSGAFNHGSGTADLFQANLTINNTGSNGISIAYNGLGHSVAGNILATNGGAGTTLNMANQATSSLAVTGNVTLTNTSSANNTIYLGNQGDITIGGTLDLTNSSTGASSTSYIANGTNSSVSITGVSTITNSGTGATTQRIYGCVAGDITFGDDLIVTNNSTATNSEMHFISGATSTGAFNGNIVLAAPNGATCDGIRFGESGGLGTLAATKTVSIGGAGFDAVILRFSNFTQTGGTAQALTTTGTSRIYITNSNWGGNVDFVGPRFYTDNTIYQGTADLDKTGASDDYSPGNNTFNMNTVLTNTGSGIFGMGNGNLDVFGADLTANNTGSSQIRLSNSASMSTVAGNFVATNSGNGTALVFSGVNSGLAITGNATVTNTSATNNTIYLGNSGSFTVGGDLTLTNSPSSATCNVYLANATASSLNVTGTTTISNNSTGTTTSDIYVGNNGDVTFGGTLNLSQTSGVTNCRFFCNNTTNSTGIYSGDIVLESTNVNGDGIYFGNSGGDGTLAAGRTVTIGAGGFVAGYLTFRNFTQVGPTPQSLTATGTAIAVNYDSDWGGDFTFIAPQHFTRGTTYNGTSYLEKTGPGNDHSVGGNLFVGNSTLVHSGANNFLHGNGNPDVFQGNVDITNSGSGNFYLAYNSPGNTVAGNVNYTHQGSAGTANICDLTASTLAITGNVVITNSSSANSSIALANAGTATVGGNIDITSTNSGASTNTYLANAASSSLVVTGNTTLTNSGTGATTQRFWVGNSGDVTFTGTLDLINNSGATNSEMFVDYAAASVGVFSQNITVQNTNATGDGVLFGSNTGSGTLAAGRTVTVGAGGFVAGFLTFRNFTQVGPTPQSLTLTGTATATNYDSDWGGDFIFIAPRHTTRGTTYHGTSYIEKTGAGNDHSVGGNLFVGNSTLVQSGSNNFLHGNGSPDVFQANVDITNSGAGNFYLAYNSAGNTVAGNLTYTQQGAALNGYICDLAASTLDIAGNVTMTNTSTANGAVAIANSGDATVGGNLTMSSDNSGISFNTYLANAATSSLIVTGNTTLTNNGTGATTQRFWIGNNGDLTFDGTLDIINNSGATNSEMYVNYNVASVGLFNQNITVQSTNAACDGIRFGQNNGSGTLSAGNSVSIGVGGFISGDLEFRNFTQVGPTVHSLTCTGTARGYNYDSNWGGDFTFIAPRMLTRGTTYNGTAYLEKTGGISNDASVGGNLFAGNAELRNSGSLYFMMGNGNPDVFQSNLLMNNTGSHSLYLANNSAGNTITGDLTINNGGSANTTYISNAALSTVTVGGNIIATNTSNGAASNIILGVVGDMDITGTVVLNNNSTSVNNYIQVANSNGSLVNMLSDLTVNNLSTGTNQRVYLANNGIMNVGGNVNLTNSGTNSISIIYLGSGTTSASTITGDLDLINDGTATTTQTFLGNNGDITFDGSVDIHNSSSSASSHVYCNHAANSTNIYNGNIIVESSSAGCDGVWFGNGNGNGTLANGQTITVGGAGFSSGYLYMRNFTQVGGTAQNLTVTNTGTIIENYNSEWNGNVDFRGPRHYTRGTTYNGTAHLEKTDATNDASAGGNTFNGVTVIENSGTGYFMPANGTGNDVNDDISFIQSSTGLIYPCYNSISTYAGDVNIDYTTNQIYFGAAGNGRATFDGAGAQAINDLGASTMPRVRDFHVDKSGGELTLNMPINITSQLDLDAGVVNTSTSSLIIMNDNTVVTSVSDASHIDGPMDKIGNDVFTFPVGNLDIYQPISMSNPSAGASRFRAQYFNTDAAPTYDDTQLDPTIHHISDCEYWTLDRIATAANVSVTLGFKPHTGACSGVTDPTTLVVARWDGTTWRDHGNGGTTGTPTVGDITTAGAVTSFSPFTLASTVDFPVNPLPVELLSFTGEKNESQVDLKWSTASEINNDYFTLEKSIDGSNFEFMTAVEGAGNSNVQNDYLHIDQNPTSGWNYYKLYQTDFNGTTAYEGQVSVYFDQNSVDVVIFPNPSNGGSFTIMTEQTENGQVHIMDAGGRLIKTVPFTGTRADIDDLGLSAGIYNIRITFNDRDVVQKLIVR